MTLDLCISIYLYTLRYLPDNVDTLPIDPFVCGHSQRAVPNGPFDVVSLPLDHSLHSPVYFALLRGDSNTWDANFVHNAAEVHVVATVDSDSFAAESCQPSCLVALDIGFSVDLVGMPYAGGTRWALEPAVSAVAAV